MLVIFVGDAPFDGGGKEVLFCTLRSSGSGRRFCWCEADWFRGVLRWQGSEGR